MPMILICDRCGRSCKYNSVRHENPYLIGPTDFLLCKHCEKDRVNYNNKFWKFEDVKKPNKFIHALTGGSIFENTKNNMR